MRSHGDNYKTEYAIICRNDSTYRCIVSASLSSFTISVLHYNFSPLSVICSSDDVAVIDEIQMIRDPERGGAWTRALLGMSFNPL